MNRKGIEVPEFSECYTTVTLFLTRNISVTARHLKMCIIKLSSKGEKVDGYSMSVILQLCYKQYALIVVTLFG